MPEQYILAKGIVDRIGQSTSRFKYNSKAEKFGREVQIKTYQDSLSLILQTITGKKIGVISHIKEIDVVGHRVVHGGNDFDSPVIINEAVIDSIKKLIPLAPLHNQPDLEGIKVAGEILSDVLQIACFDTTFHRTIPQTAFMYGLPYELYEKHNIRRFGFHGISHSFVADRAIQLLNKDGDTNIITCHLGNGCSITAIKDGHSIDTSMGFTPMEGLLMGTRSGDFDPAIIFYLESKGYKREQLNSICNKQSGLLGISGISNDIRELLKAISESNKRAELAIEIFCYRIKKYIGAYTAILGKLDAIVFTGGIGENCPQIRAKACDSIAQLGVEIDQDKNDFNENKERYISKPQSKVKILVIPTNEELAIATDCFELIKER
jgi:acetate kinase